MKELKVLTPEEAQHVIIMNDFYLGACIGLLFLIALTTGVGLLWLILTSIQKVFLGIILVAGLLVMARIFRGRNP